MIEPVITSAARGPVDTECEEVSVGVAAYLVHLVWQDLARWDDRRKLRREEAANFAQRLASKLPPHVRARLEAIRARPAA